MLNNYENIIYKKLHLNTTMIETPTYIVLLGTSNLLFSSLSHSIATWSYSLNLGPPQLKSIRWV